MPVWRCPNCGGNGHMPDMAVEISAAGCRILKPASVCQLCEGKKAVFIRPATDEEARIVMTTTHILDTRFGGE